MRAVTTGCPLTWRNSRRALISYGMTLIPPMLAAIPALVTLAVAAGRVMVPLAREARLVAVVWLALRRTRPDERAEIIRALLGEPQHGLVNDKSARRPPERPE